MTFDSDRGLIHLRSPYSVSDTLGRLEDIVRARGLAVLARIDHSGDAARVGLMMNPAQLLIFGNAIAGTPLMVASPTLAIDLPLKAVAWQDSNEQVWLSYNDPGYLKERHSVPLVLMHNIAGIKELCEDAVRT